MKRFHWPLQRLLEVTLQRERALQMKLIALRNRIESVHQEIFRRQASLRGALDELGREVLSRRLPRQQIFMKYSDTEEARMNWLKGRLEDLQNQQAEMMDAFTRKRSMREALERLREEASQQYAREIAKQEQKQLDESSQVAFVRKMQNQ